MPKDLFTFVVYARAAGLFAPRTYTLPSDIVCRALTVHYRNLDRIAHIITFNVTAFS